MLLGSRNLLSPHITTVGIQSQYGCNGRHGKQSSTPKYPWQLRSGACRPSSLGSARRFVDRIRLRVIDCVLEEPSITVPLQGSAAPLKCAVRCGSCQPRIRLSRTIAWIVFHGLDSEFIVSRPEPSFLLLEALAKNTYLIPRFETVPLFAVEMSAKHRKSLCPAPPCCLCAWERWIDL